MLASQRLSYSEEVLIYVKVLFFGILFTFLIYIFLFPGDGRRLTLLIYLNPGWKKEDGGALRLFPNNYQNSKAGAEGTILCCFWFNATD